MNMDIPSPFPESQADPLRPQQQQQQGQGTTGVMNGGGGVFMGVDTPPRNAMI